MGRSPSGMSARALIRAFLDELPVGAKFTSEQLQEVAGIQEFARRLREIRQEEGYDISGYKEALDLKPNEYRLRGKGSARPARARVAAADSKRLLRERPYCQLCGRGSGAYLPGSSVRRVKLHVHHFLPQARAGSGEVDNLLVLCSYCNEGLKDQTVIESFVKSDDLLSQLKEKGPKVKLRVQDILSKWAFENTDI